MKPTVFFLLVITFFGCTCQKMVDKQYDFDKRIRVAYVNPNGKMEFTINAEDFLTILNQKLYKGTKMLDKLTIENGLSSGLKQIPFHYISATSDSRNLQVVRYLVEENGNFYLDVVEKGEFFSFETFFVTCEGTSACAPRLFFTDKGVIWSCRESYVCATPEQAELDKCRITKTIF